MTSARPKLLLAALVFAGTAAASPVASLRRDSSTISKHANSTS
jgi:hypothetical protein